jgi:hypothetical protein
MATAHSPFQPGEAFSLPSQHWSDENWSAWTDPFDTMPESELDFWVGGFAPSDVHQDALPARSSSPEDGSDSNPQLTPSSTANDSPGNTDHSDHTSFELVSNNTSSPAERFEEVSLMNSDFSNHSPVNQRVLPSSDATLSSSQQSREPSNGPTYGSREQDWSSSFSTSSGGHAPAASPYNGFVTNESTGTISDNLLADMAIPFRLSQPSEPWATTALQSITWGNIQQPMFPMQQQSFGNAVPYQFNEHMGNYEFETPMGNVPNMYNGLTNLTHPGLPYQGQPQHDHYQPLPGPAIHRPQQLAMLPTNISHPQPQPSSTRADLAQSTRLRFPDHPKLSAEQNPPSLIPNLRPIAAASGERRSVTVSSRGAQNTRQKQGGRKRNSHLNPDARDRSSKMRKKGACWRCKLQRDPVSSVVSTPSIAFTDISSALTMVHLAGDALLDRKKASNTFSTAIGQSSRTLSWTSFQPHTQLCTPSKTSKTASDIKCAAGTSLDLLRFISLAATVIPCAGRYMNSSQRR